MKKHFMKTILTTLALTTAAIGTSSCATSSVTMRTEIARRLASPTWMIEREVAANGFSLTVFERMHERGDPVTIYIEGDGPKNIAHTGMVRDPTPINPVALHLATRDKSKNTAYIARPCQYSKMVSNKESCDSKYWGDARYSPDVIAAYNTTLNKIKGQYSLKGIHLVGYDGGAAIATALAAERNDILSIRTVAGVLDHDILTNYHKGDQLTGSINPVTLAPLLKTIPQVHFIGGQDQVVPPAALNSYLQALGNNACVKHEFIQEAEHDKGWVDKWPALLKITPECKRLPVSYDYNITPAPEPIYTSRPIPFKP